jgi:hypothetical protein
MLLVVRRVALAMMLGAGGAASAFAQAPPLVFTVAVPDTNASATTVRASAAVEERGLALWSGSASDFGIGVDVAGSKWAVHSIASMTALPIQNHLRPTFQQVEVMRSFFSAASVSVAGGGGIREEWDGTRVLVGRVLAGTDVRRGRLEGSLVMERAVASAVRHDAADVVTSVGWSRRVGDRMAVGVEGIGQDLEGFWDPSEAEGGAKLLVGLSLRLQSKNGDWSASAVVGPVMRSTSSAAVKSSSSRYDGARHLGIFASATWMPSVRRTGEVGR